MIAMTRRGVYVLAHVDPARARQRDDGHPSRGGDRRVDRARAASRTTRAMPLTSQLIGAKFSRNRALSGAHHPSSRSEETRICCDEGTPRFFEAVVPGAGFEPALLGSEPSVLPSRRSRIEQSKAVVGPEGLEPSLLG
jgi:hypothetical protein